MFIDVDVPELIQTSQTKLMPRTLDETVDWDEDEPTQYVPLNQFAEAAGVSRSWASKAARNDYLVEGMPVAQWLVQDRYGRVRGFDVPESVWKGLTRTRYER